MGAERRDGALMNAMAESVLCRGQIAAGLTTDLCEQRLALTAYLLSKVKAGDWHGVADAAMDLREIEAKLSVLNA